MQEYLKFWDIERPIFQDHDMKRDLLTLPRDQQLLSRLSLFCENKTNILAVTGAPGVGKTVLARQLYERLAVKHFEVAFIAVYQAEHGAGWLAPKLAHFFQADPPVPQSAHMACIAQNLDDIRQQRRHLVVVIDEAHRLKTTESFDEIMSLIGMQAAAGPVITFVLVGNEDLAALLAAQPSIGNRLAFQATLPTLNAEEARQYLHARLKSVGLSSRLITDDAMHDIFDLTQGIYSVMNALMENAFVEAYLSREKQISAAIVAAAWQYLPQAERMEAPMKIAGGANDAARPRREKPPRPRKTPPPPEREEAKKPTRDDNIKLSSLFYKNKTN